MASLKNSPLEQQMCSPSEVVLGVATPLKHDLHHIHSKMRLRNRDTDNVETSDSVNVTSDVTGGHAKVGNGRARGLRGATKVSSSPSLGVRRLVKRGDILFLKFR
uniref:Uncharacterized protein n=1 Tax=Parascaris univalens TaxID=6257 RepID=A0A915A3K6_PARUN